MNDQKIENFKIQVDRRRSTRKLRKISISFYSLLKNSQKSANNRFHVKCVKYQTFTMSLTVVWLIFDEILHDDT